jgi:ATP-dependent Lon protease
MSAFDDFSFCDEEFSGRTRLFPLPNLVLFPNVMQPLHIFEPRYCEMLEDALADDRLIAMALLAPGWESEYYGRPSLHSMVCLGRVVLYHRLESGSYNLLLVGLRRARLVRELAPVRSYREAIVEICGDSYPADRAGDTPSLHRRLRDSFVRLIPHLPQSQELLDQLLSTDISLGKLTDVVSYVLDIPIPQKERLLSETNVHRRAEMLLEHLSATAADLSKGPSGASEFPPQFSPN